MNRTSWSLLATSALTLAALSAPSAHADGGTPPPTTPAGPAIALRAPATSTSLTEGQGARQRVPLDLRVVAPTAPLEIWSTRSSYDDPIHSVWRSPAGDVALPAGSMQTFGGLRRFFRVEIEDLHSHASRTVWKSACLNGYGERVRPDASPYSPYPQDCYSNPYSLGSVQGIQAGWAVPELGYDQPLRLADGRYDITVSVAPAYAATFGLSAGEASTRTRLTVKRDPDGGGVVHPGGPPHPVPLPEERRADGHSTRVAGPQGDRVASTDGPVPDLRALPAWGIQVAPKGNYLQFSATVWNAGTSPLVVDGFRRDGEDEMDAYQYFFDSEGNQTGYTPVGGMHWDPRPTHQHWHFEDFATYTLLDSQKNRVVRSRKEAFCLANTDAVDLTVPDAEWDAYNTDLSTACGDYGSLSVREVLLSGWGDTYAQFRAGQSFSLQGLPNGTYYIEVEANPYDRLTESSLDNNTSLRKVVIGGTPGHRTVRVPQVGLVVEPTQDTEGVQPGH